MPGTRDNYEPYISSGGDYSLYQLGAYHMIDEDGYEPQRNNNFELHIYGLDNVSSIDKRKQYDSSIVKNTLTLSTVSVTALGQSVDVIQVPYGNTKVKYAGLPTIDDVTVVYNDYIGKETERIISGWFGLVFNQKTEKIGRASDYKKSAILVETAPDGSHARSWQVDGCWPSSVKYGDYSYDGNGQVRQITVTLTLDKMIPLD